MHKCNLLIGVLIFLYFKSNKCIYLSSGIKSLNKFLYYSRITQYYNQNQKKTCSISDGPYCYFTENDYTKHYIKTNNENKQKIESYSNEQFQLLESNKDLLQKQQENLQELEQIKEEYSEYKASSEKKLQLLETDLEKGICNEMSIPYEFPIKCVITVPAYFTHRQRTNTILAAKLANIDVLKIINEPTAAAIAFSLNESTTECKIDPRTLYSNTISINMDYNGFFLLHQNIPLFIFICFTVNIGIFI